LVANGVQRAQRFAELARKRPMAGSLDARPRRHEPFTAQPTHHHVTPSIERAHGMERRRGNWQPFVEHFEER
jgi:hypothetical protein